jgi:hypothetical protein
LLAGAFAATGASADEDKGPFPLQFVVSSTIPSNGDLNPYGIVFVPKDFPSGGKIAPGDVLVSNFNNFKNLQGTGVTIIKFTPAGPVAPSVSPGQNGTATTFFTSKPQGLTTALGILRKGFIVVGEPPLDRRHVPHDRARVPPDHRPPRPSRQDLDGRQVSRQPLGSRHQ